jgi:ATP-dependent DNA helicase RecG
MSALSIFNKKTLLERLKMHEWEDFEVKAAKNEVPKSAWETVSSFSNTEGGSLVFGVKDNGGGKFEITGVENVEKVQNDFLSTLRGEKFNIQLSSKAHILDFDGKMVLLFHINSMPRNCKPIYFGGDIRNTYIRRGSGDYKCSREEVNRMLREASEFSSDSMILEGYGVKDIDSKTVSEYKNLLELRLSESLFHKLKTSELLMKLGCLKVNPASGKEELTMAGLLVFGKEDSIRSRFPAYEFDIYLIRSREKGFPDIRWDDRKIYEVNLFQTFYEAMNYIKSKVEIPFMMEPDNMTRTENVPIVVAMREALVNVLIHRDYFDNTQARLRIFNDRIETYNAGAAPKTAEEIISNEATAPRNPLIAKLFRMVGFAETAGSGMLKIFSAWKQLNYKTPVIDNNVSNYYFKMTFPLEEKRSGVKPVSGRHQAGTKSAPSRHQVGTKSALSPESLKILKYCAGSKSLLEIMALFELKDRTKFRNKYIIPLINDGLLELTIPDKPNSSKQKYMKTDKGKKVIS